MTYDARATQQLFSRPPEDQFSSMSDLLEDAAKDRFHSTEPLMLESDFHFTLNADNDICLSLDSALTSGDIVPSGNAPLSHRALQWLCSNTEAGLSPKLLGTVQRGTAMRILEDIYSRGSRKHIRKLLISPTGTVRAINSTYYKRLFDHQILEDVNRWLIPDGWIPAVPTFRQDFDTSGGKPALFRSDKSMFAFFYSPQSTDLGDDGGLRKGLCVGNSETGDGALTGAQFCFREVCGNFLIWGVEGLEEFSVRHMGESFDESVLKLHTWIRNLSTAFTDRESSLIREAMRATYATTDHLAAQRLRKEVKGMTASASKAAIERVYYDENPGVLTNWGVAQGLSTLAKEKKYALDRLPLMRAAGSLLTTT